MDGDALRAVLALSNSVRRILSNKNKEYGVSGSQIRLLHEVQRAEIKGEDINQKELESIFNIQKSSMSELLRSMEIKGLINRMSSKDDSRIKNVTLTDKGKRLSYVTYNDIVNLQNRCSPKITVEELEITLQTLVKMLDTLEGGKHDDEEN